MYIYDNPSCDSGAIACGQTHRYGKANISGNLVMHLKTDYVMIGCTYGGEPNGNLKSAIKILNTNRLSCKLTTMILIV